MLGGHKPELLDLPSLKTSTFQRALRNVGGLNLSVLLKVK